MLWFYSLVQSTTKRAFFLMKHFRASLSMCYTVLSNGNACAVVMLIVFVRRTVICWNWLVK